MMKKATNFSSTASSTNLICFAHKFAIRNEIQMAIHLLFRFANSRRFLEEKEIQ